MGDTIKDKAEENKHNNEQLTKTEVKSVPTPLTLGNFLLALLVVVIISTGSLVYYMIRQERQGYEQYNNFVQSVPSPENQIDGDSSSENSAVNETIKDIIDSATNSTSSGDTNTVNAVDANNRKVMNENLIVLYNGLILDTKNMKQTELKYIDNSDQYKDKYVITYYNYENYGFKESKLGSLSSPVFDGLVKIDNVGKIAISESYEAIPREVKVVNAIPTSISDKNPKIGDFDSTKAIITDLDGNGTEEYILVLSKKTTGYSKIVLVDSSGTKVADLAYIEKSKWESVTTEDYHLSLSNVEIIDIDNDGIMEILVELPRYEGDPTISLLKYKNGELQGETNIECSLLP